MKNKSFEEFFALLQIVIMFFAKAVIFALPIWIIYLIGINKIFESLPNINYFQFVLMMWGIDLIRFNIGTLVNRK